MSLARFMIPKYTLRANLPPGCLLLFLLLLLSCNFISPSKKNIVFMCSCLQRAEESIGSLLQTVTYKTQGGCWELDPGHLQEQPMLLTAE